jgi:hypothetical protein
MFFGPYERRLWVNHIDDSAFAFVYTVNAFLLLAGLFSVALLRGPNRSLAWIPLVANILGWVTVFVMHRTGVLVTYEEFIDHGFWP